MIRSLLLVDGPLPGGVGIMATSLFGSAIVFFALMILMVLIPTVYSYLFYRKKK